MVKKHFIVLIFWLLALPAFNQDLIARVTVKPQKAYIGQPVQLVVSVYTTTWFTSGVDVGNIQVDGALTVYFRSVSNSKTIKGKKYAGVDFYYNLFPVEDEIIQIPALEIRVESPEEGGYKGIKRVIKTSPKTIGVSGVPLGYDPNNWLVAKSLNVSQDWSKALNDVKVGDVIRRTIKRDAGGTLGEFIPETAFDSIPGVSIYPKRPQVKTNKSKTGVSAQRIEAVSYLFEKEGEVTLPAIEYMYWNPANGKFYKKQIAAITIQVKPNADLAMLASIKKSLQQEKAGEEEQFEEKPFLIFGLDPATFFKYLLGVLIAGFVLFKAAKKLMSLYKKKQAKYLKSERYAFLWVEKSLRKNDYYGFVKAGNQWLSKLPGNLSMEGFVKEYGSAALKQQLKQINESYFKNNQKTESGGFADLLKELQKARKNYHQMVKEKLKSNKIAEGWLNPVSVE